jgi:hypothetical protein
MTWPKPLAFAKFEASVWRELGVKKAMGWYEDTVSGVETEAASKEVYPQFGIEFRSYRFTTGTKDFSDLILKAKAFDPEIPYQGAKPIPVASSTISSNRLIY